MLIINKNSKLRIKISFMVALEISQSMEFKIPKILTNNSKLKLILNKI
jgi:hypothetical protein